MLSQNDKTEKFSPKGDQEEITVKNLLKTNISNLSEQEFGTIRLLSGLEKKAWRTQKKPLLQR